MAHEQLLFFSTHALELGRYVAIGRGTVVPRAYAVVHLRVVPLRELPRMAPVHRRGFAVPVALFAHRVYRVNDQSRHRWHCQPCPSQTASRATTPVEKTDRRKCC